MQTYYVYITANQNNTVLYIGVTNDLVRRMYEHKRGMNKGFCYRYNVNKLLYFEETDDITVAIQREKQLKRWHRAWKENLIASENPNCDDLSASWFDETGGC